MAQVRASDAHWEGDLLGGNGSVTAATSGTFGPLGLTWKARAEADDTGLTSPEELLAAAHASCFSMACSNELAKAGTPPTRLDVTVAVTGDKLDTGWTVLAAAITVTGQAPGATEASFREAAEKAKDGCPISKALRGNVELSVEATLEA